MSDPGEAPSEPGTTPGPLGRRLGRALGAASAAVLALLALLATVETAAWLLAERSWPQLAEIQGLLLVWLTFLTAAWAVAEGLHLSLGLLVDRLPPRARRRLHLLAELLVALFGALCLWHGARLSASVVNTLPATGWSAAWQYAPAVAGGALIALVALLRLLAAARRADAGSPG